MSTERPLTLFLNAKRGVSVYSIQHNDNNPNAPIEQQITHQETNITNEPNEGVVFSPNGQYVAVIYKDRVSVHDTVNQFTQVKCIAGEDGASVSNVQFSPLNTFIVTLGKYSPHKSSTGNLVIWKLFPEADDGQYDANSCKILMRTTFKANNTNFWPIVQWNEDESICAIWQQELKSINFYKYAVLQPDAQRPKSKEPSSEDQEEQIEMPVSENEKTFQLVYRFKKPKVLKFQLSPKSTFAIHTTNQTNQHLVQIYKYQVAKPTCFISFFTEKHEEVDVEMKWNSNGTALLVHTTASTDAENENYYGKSQVYFMRANGNFTCQVTLTKSGPVHDIAWSPKGNEFCMVYGFTPMKATLFNDSTQAIFEFGTSTRNKCSWSPNGKFLCLAGFGSLTGKMEFWDREKKKLIGQAEAKEASVYGWASDSRLFYTATVTPTLRVSNKIQLWKYNGMLMHERPFDVLYSASWNNYAPTTVATEEDQKQKKSANQAKQTSNLRLPSPRGINEGQSLLRTQVTAPKKAYVPPSLRGGPMDDSVYKRDGHEAPSKPISSNNKGNIQQQQQAAKVAQLQRMIPGLPASAALKQVQATSGTSGTSAAPKKKRKRNKNKKKTSDGNATTETSGDDQKEE